jgi:hypothetical protein
VSDAAPRPAGSPPSTAQKAPRPKVKLEVVNPDDVLILGVNDTWYRSFSANSDRYPVAIEVPPDVIKEGWNFVTGAYTNVALPGKNEASVNYKVFLDDAEVVTVTYKAELQPQTFTINFKDSFHLRQKAVDRGQSTARASSRFQDLMKFQSPGGAPPGGPPPKA